MTDKIVYVWFSDRNESKSELLFLGCLYSLILCKTGFCTLCYSFDQNAELLMTRWSVIDYETFWNKHEHQRTNNTILKLFKKPNTAFHIPSNRQNWQILKSQCQKSILFHTGKIKLDETINLIYMLLTEYLDVIL